MVIYAGDVPLSIYIRSGAKYTVFVPGAAYTHKTAQGGAWSWGLLPIPLSAYSKGNNHRLLETHEDHV